MNFCLDRHSPSLSPWIFPVRVLLLIWQSYNLQSFNTCICIIGLRGFWVWVYSNFLIVDSAQIITTRQDPVVPIVKWQCKAYHPGCRVPDLKLSKVSFQFEDLWFDIRNRTTIIHPNGTSSINNRGGQCSWAWWSDEDRRLWSHNPRSVNWKNCLTSLCLSFCSHYKGKIIHLP